VDDAGSPRAGSSDLARLTFEQVRRAARRNPVELSARRSPIDGRRRRRGPLDPALRLDQVLWELLAKVGAPGVVLDVRRFWSRTRPSLLAGLEPVDFDPSSGCLTLEAASRAWAIQTRLMATGLLADLQTGAGLATVRTLAIRDPAPQPGPATRTHHPAVPSIRDLALRQLSAPEAAAPGDPAASTDPPEGRT
jgi:hypothetical protein